MIKLRPAQYSDYTAIAKLHANSWRQNYRGILSDNYLDNEVEKDRMDVWYQRFNSPADNQVVTIAELDETIAGFCCVFLDDDPVFGSLVDNFHVSMNFQRSGVGTRLFKESARIILDKSENNKMYLWVFEANQNARIVYERLGGTRVETIDMENEDQTISETCRYTWDDVSKLL